MNIYTNNLFADSDARSMTQAETPGVTHFGAYHRPPDGHFCMEMALLEREEAKANL